jgi:hypothetical protein
MKGKAEDSKLQILQNIFRRWKNKKKMARQIPALDSQSQPTPFFFFLFR